MPTANPLLIPELRGMLAEGDTTGLREVAEELHPATVAEFTEGLDDAEIWRMLDAVPVERQSEIFPYYPRPRQVALMKASDRQHLGGLIEWMAPDSRDDLLRELDPEQRAILILCDCRSLPYEEIAQVLGVAVGTVKSRVFRARTALRDVVEQMARASAPRMQDGMQDEAK